MRKIMVLCGALAVFSLFAGLARPYGEVYYHGTLDRDNYQNSTMVTTTAVAGFVGLTFDELVSMNSASKPNYVIYGQFTGGWISAALRGTAVGLYNLQVHRDANGVADKAIGMLTLKDGANMKSTVVELIPDANRGIQVKSLEARYRATTDYAHKFATLAADGVVTYDGSRPGVVATEYANGTYGVCGLATSLIVPPSAPQLVFANAAEESVLTVEDLRHYDFTARMSGKSFDAKDSLVKGWNKKVFVDGDGCATKIRLEMQGLDDRYLKCVIVELTNGEGGVCAQAVAARYAATSSGAGLGYKFVNESDAYVGSQGANVGKLEEAGYCVYEMKALPPPESAELVLDASKTWSELTADAGVIAPETRVTVRVTGESPVLTLDESVSMLGLVFVNASETSANTVTLTSANGDRWTTAELALENGISLQTPVDLTVQIASFQLNEGSRLGLSGTGTCTAQVHGTGGVDILSGTVGMSNPLNDYMGGTQIKAGATAQQLAMCTTPVSMRIGPFGAAVAANVITVEPGGHFDVRGQADVNYFFAIGSDDAIINSGSPINGSTSQMMGFTLTDNVTYDSSIGYSILTPTISVIGSKITLPENYTFTKTGTTTPFYVRSVHDTEVVGTGTFRVAEGEVWVTEHGKMAGAQYTAVVDPEATLRLDNTFQCNVLTNDGTIVFNPRPVSGSQTNVLYTNDRIVGNGIVRKTGANYGRMMFNNMNTNMTYYVEAGTLAIGKVTLYPDGNRYTFNTEENPHANQQVIVSDGATFDVNGFRDFTAHLVISGTGVGGNGALVNRGARIDSNNAEFVQLTLADDALVGGTADFGLLAPHYQEARLELDGHDLTIDKDGAFWLTNARIRGEGAVRVRRGALTLHAAAPQGTDWSLEVGADGIFSNRTYAVSVKDLKVDGEIAGTGKITVSGVVTAGAGTIPDLSLADGSVIKVTAGDKPLVVTSAFASTGVVTFDFAGFTVDKTQTRIPLISVPADSQTTDAAVYRAVDVPEGYTFSSAGGTPHLSRFGFTVSIR